EAVRILNIEKESQLFIKKLTQGIEITENIQEPSKLLKELSKVVGIAPLAISTPITACLFSSKIKDGYKKFTQASNYDEIKIDINNYIENGMPEYLDVLKNKGFGRKNILNMLKSKGFSKDHVLSKAVRVAHSAIRTPTTCFFASKIKNGYKKFTQTSNYDEIKIDINDYIENGMPEYLDVLRSKGFSKEQIHEIKYQNIDVDTFVSITFSLVAAQHGIKEIENDIASVEYKFTDNLKILAKNLVELSLL
ncbi:MAG: hypothetical protein GY715_05685, partial [Planctomycetes bacterium]|nr:hypothetical protein [Planctomycetota bacterium]MCP4081541.1 hypothetical protein [Planctomycetaceae bacterium]